MQSITSYIVKLLNIVNPISNKLPIKKRLLITLTSGIEYDKYEYDWNSFNFRLAI